MTKATKMLNTSKKVRGATMVEYALLLVVIFVAAVVGIKVLGPKVAAGTALAGATF